MFIEFFATLTGYATQLDASAKTEPTGRARYNSATGMSRKNIIRHKVLVAVISEVEDDIL